MIRKFVIAIFLNLVLGEAAWIDPRFIAERDAINNDPTCTFKAEVHPGIPYGDPEKLRAMVVSTPDSETEKSAPVESDPLIQSRRLQSLPTSYDLRTAYPKCWSIGYIRSQGGCTTSMIIAGSAAMSDNYCIQYQKKGIFKQRSFSYEDIMENCSYADCTIKPGEACYTEAPSMRGAFEFAKNVGVVTGENYGNFTSCKPYLINPSTSRASSPPPNTKCNPNSKGYTIPYAKDKFKILYYSSIAGTMGGLYETLGMQAIYKYGSVISRVVVTNEFYYYKSGVYQIRKAAIVGNPFSQIVRVIGWGFDSASGLKYWLAANSWGPGWGIKGFFKIIKGINHYHFEDVMLYPVMF